MNGQWVLENKYSLPELITGCEEVLYEDKDEVKCARVEVVIRKQKKAFDFNVQRESITDTLDKILEWLFKKKNMKSVKE